MADRTLPIRLDEALIERLDQLAKVLTDRASGVKISRTGAMRATIERGLEAFEAEPGYPRPKRKRP